MPLTYPQLIVLAGFGLVLLELVIGIEAGFDLVLIGSILIFSGFLGSFTQSFLVTLVTASLLAFIYIAFGRQRLRQKISPILTHKTNIDKLIGVTGYTIRSITPDTAGLVRLNDEDWRAISDEVIYEKDAVEVLAVEGVSIKVKKLLNVKPKTSNE